MQLALMWMQLEGIMLNKLSQGGEDKYHITSFTHSIQTKATEITISNNPQILIFGL